ncbi:MAG: sensor histidine kinase [Rhodoglobus sp.]
MAERRGASIRLRITAIASAVVAVVLVLGAVLFVLVMREALVDGVRTAAGNDASVIAERIHDSKDFSLTESELDADDQLIQLVRDGAVIAASDDAEELGPLAEREGSATVSVLHEDRQYVVAAEESRDDVLVVVGHDLSDVDESIAAIVPLVAVSIPVLVALLAITTWIVVGRALRPVERMRVEVDEVTANRLDRRIAGADAPDELGRLAATMNRMLDRLDDSQRTQRRFISDASHELKSPLASLKQYAEVARSYPDRMTAAELTEAIDDEGGRLERIVRGMLVLARADEGSLRKAARPVDLDDLLLQEAQRVKASTALTVDAAIEPARIEGDAELLAQVVRNLVDNAARHARSRVSLSLTSRGVIVVDDDGPGIPQSERERIFERFVRLDDARARDAGGSGLGLAIVREIVGAHGGTVVASESPFGGARFTVTLA